MRESRGDRRFGRKRRECGSRTGRGFSQMAGGTGRGAGRTRLRVERSHWKGLESPSTAVHRTSALGSSTVLCRECRASAR